MNFSLLSYPINTFSMQFTNTFMALGVHCWPLHKQILTCRCHKKNPVKWTNIFSSSSAADETRAKEESANSLTLDVENRRPSKIKLTVQLNGLSSLSLSLSLCLSLYPSMSLTPKQAPHSLCCGSPPLLSTRCRGCALPCCALSKRLCGAGLGS